MAHAFVEPEAATRCDESVTFFVWPDDRPEMRSDDRPLALWAHGHAFTDTWLLRRCLMLAARIDIDTCTVRITG